MSGSDAPIQINTKLERVLVEEEGTPTTISNHNYNADNKSTPIADGKEADSSAGEGGETIDVKAVTCGGCINVRRRKSNMVLLTSLFVMRRVCIKSMVHITAFKILFKTQFLCSFVGRQH
jgi:hypothetical protein